MPCVHFPQCAKCMEIKIKIKIGEKNVKKEWAREREQARKKRREYSGRFRHRAVTVPHRDWEHPSRAQCHAKWCERLGGEGAKGGGGRKTRRTNAAVSLSPLFFVKRSCNERGGEVIPRLYQLRDETLMAKGSVTRWRFCLVFFSTFIHNNTVYNSDLQQRHHSLSSSSSSISFPFSSSSSFLTSSSYPFSSYISPSFSFKKWTENKSE